MEGEHLGCLRIIEFFVALAPSIVLGRAWLRARKRVKELQTTVNEMGKAMENIRREQERR